MNAKEALAKLEALGDEKRRDWNIKNGAAKGRTFGVETGKVRALARQIKSDHALGLQLWKTGNVDAQLLAILILKPKELSAKEVDRMVREARFAWVADWVNAYLVKEQPPADKEALRQKWMEDDDAWAARAGWNLTASRIAQMGKMGNGAKAAKTSKAGGAGKPAKGAKAEVDGRAEELDLPALLERIEREMAAAPPETQWTMNNTLMAIGIHHVQQRKRAIAIGEKIGLYKDWPVSKGCTPPYAPLAIAALVKRQG